MATDIRSDHFLFRHAPAAWHPYILLARLDRPAGTWLLLLPCWWALALAGGTPVLFALFALGALLMRSAGCIVNDLWDRKLDASVARTRQRPLAAGTLTPRQALGFLAVLLLASLGILLALDRAAIALGVAALLPVAVYPLMKRITWWPQLFLGLTFNWGALMGFAAATGGLPAAAWLMYAGGIFWTLVYDTIYAHQDRADDALVGIKSTALLFGAHSKRWTGGFLAAALVLFAASKYAADGTWPVLLLLPAAHGFATLWRWRIDDAGSSLAAFRAHVVFGWLMLFFFAL